MSNGKMRVVVVGGGFGGLYATLGLSERFEVTLVDRRNFHLFQPLLYQVATGGLSPADIAAPLRKVVRRRRNVRVLLSEVLDFDPERRRVLTAGGELPYDALVVAAGMRNHYFGHEDWERHAPGLKTIEDATRMRSRILAAFESAESARDPAERDEWLSFMIIGGGPTGVELAGSLGELARDTLARDFRRADVEKAEIRLVELGDRVLPSFPESLSTRAARSLTRLGVEVRTRTRVVAMRDGEVDVDGPNGSETIRARTVLWAAGVAASPLGEALARRTGAALDRQGRVIVEPDLSVPGHPEVLVVGDLARFEHSTGTPLPGVAPVAMQQGRYVAELLDARAGGASVPPFRYRDRGNLATIGRAAAVADLGESLRFSGLVAWLLWLFVHLLYLVGFENRMLVLFQWAWNYFTWNRSARLITKSGGTPEDTREEANERDAIATSDTPSR